MTQLYFGVVEDRIKDPLKLGRLKVRVVGIHTENILELPTDELPWAQVMQPTNSSANSGIGHSPTGIVEATWVIVMFRDEYKQQPIVIGTVPGIPEEIVEIPTIDQDLTLGAPGAPEVEIKYDPEVPLVPEVVEPRPVQTGAFKPAGMKMSDDGFDRLLAREGISTSVKGKNKLISKNAPDSTPVYSYKDSGGVWTIGVGNTRMPDGSKVGPDSQLTKGESIALFKKSVDTDYGKDVANNVKVPLTQSQFDSVVSMDYNIGPGVKKTKFFSTLNSGKYEQAADMMPATIITVKGVIDQGLINRRKTEQKQFLGGGIPKDDGKIKQTLATSPPPPIDPTKNPVVKKAETPDIDKGVIIQPSKQGFEDPNHVYPLYLGEPDTHRLARAEGVDGTVVLKKEAARVKDVKTATGDKWDQPEIPYAAEYPFNHVYASESGHLQEFDDTEGAERTHLYHMAGTWSEIDCNGTRVNRIVGDDFEILERNGHMLVKGTLNITVIGDLKIRCENNTTLETLGNLDIKVGKDMNVGVMGDLNFDVDGKIAAQAGGTWSALAGGVASLDGASTQIQSGVSAPVKALKPDDAAKGLADFPELEVPTREPDLAYGYEYPDDSDPSAGAKHQDALIAAGQLTPEQVEADKISAATNEKERVTEEKATGATPTTITGAKSVLTEKPTTTKPTVAEPIKGGTGPSTPPVAKPEPTKPTSTADSAKPAVKPSDTTSTTKPVADVPTVVVEKAKITPAQPVTESSFSKDYQLTTKLTLGDICRGEKREMPNGKNCPLPAKETVSNLRELTINVIEPIYMKYPSAKVSNTFRSFTHNKSVGGVSNSDHLRGEAADINIGAFGSDRKLYVQAAKDISQMLPSFHKLILEYSSDGVWLHISYKKSGNAKAMFTMASGTTWAQGYKYKPKNSDAKKEAAAAKTGTTGSTPGKK